MRDEARCTAILILTVVCATTAAASEVPVAVSPGHSTHLVQVEARCPTFNWGSVAGARSYQLVVYRLLDEESEEEAKPVVRATVPGSALGWTPALDRCLQRGGRYAWSVRAIGTQRTSAWSSPNLFRVVSVSIEEEFEQALETIRRYLTMQGDPQPTTLKAAPVRGGPRAEAEARQTDSSPKPTLVPEAPAMVSLVTEGAVGVGTSTPLADLHVVGGPASAGVLVGPNAAGGGGVSELLLAEDDDGGFGMKLKYDGTGAINALQIWGRQGDADIGPWLSVHRSTGAATFGGQISGDGSGLTAVDADTLDSLDSTAFSTLAQVTAEVDADILTHAGNSSAHHAPVVLGEITPTTTKGDLVVEDGSEVVRLPVGTDGQVLMADSGTTQGVGWAGVSTRRSFYLAKSSFADGEWTGDIATQACGAGFHMASIWEILDPSNLSYASMRADAVTADDSGAGPPSAGRLGWVRTGNVSASSGDWGEANCNAWTTKATHTYGTTVYLPGTWVYTNDEVGTVEPWGMSVEDCHYPYPVWCIED